MDNNDHEKEIYDKKNANTEYLPTKCRVTRPPPPKPATNPLQFVKVAPCPLFQKAQEQIKKVEEIKKERKEIRDETEDWQQNLDNWKSSRRKRQEHIIERVVEVKKLTEQEELDKTRRKSKTFSEMLEERSQKGRSKFNISIYKDDDSNDLSDYGIGSSSSKTNSVKDVDTDDNNSTLDEKDQPQLFDSSSTKETLSSSPNQSQSEDEIVNMLCKNDNSLVDNATEPKKVLSQKPAVPPKLVFLNNNNKFIDNNKDASKQYTYEGAIQDYRSRIQTKIKVDESIFTKNKDICKSKEFSEAQTVLPKGEISKRKGLFESSKSSDLEYSSSSRKLSEDFSNGKSIKDRLKSLENSADQSVPKAVKNEIQISVKQRLENFAKQNETEIKNNEKTKPKPNKISKFLLDKSSSMSALDNRISYTSWAAERCSSPETDLYMNKLNIFNRDLDNLISTKSNDNHIEDYCISNYPPSNFSELTGILSDREDSGIHTADVSCSVSQADEPIDTDNDISNTIPNCIEKLKKTADLNLVNQIVNEEQICEEPDLNSIKEEVDTVAIETNGVKEKPNYDTNEILDFTKKFLDSLILDATQNISMQKELLVNETKTEIEDKQEQIPECGDMNKTKQNVESSVVVENYQIEYPRQVSKPVLYENIQLSDNIPLVFLEDDFSLSLKKLEPPKEKPPPPPPPEEDEDEAEILTKPIKRLNSTKRIKKEINSKRSSFLGLEDTNIDLDLDQIIEKPPDINTFLQKEQKLEKSLYRKMQEENKNGYLSKVESQDSGLDIDRGRLSSDTWCSSILSHERQDSEQTTSITSEEDEITKKEREIIEMVEKEEKSKDNSDLKKDKFNNNTSLASRFSDTSFTPVSSCYLEDDEDSEVLKVERELIQLEREELERRRENLLFQESRNNARALANRRSFENIYDDIYPTYVNTDYRKSMPELQHITTDFRQPINKTPTDYYENLDQNRSRKSMPDIQRVYQSFDLDQPEFVSNNLLAIDHRQSMPELQRDVNHSAFIAPPSTKNQLIVPPNNMLRTAQTIKPRTLNKPNVTALSAVPRNKRTDTWITHKTNPEAKSYNQHWVFQEAELRRITEQNQKASMKNRQDKPLPDSVIQTITQRVQNRNNFIERNQLFKKFDANQNKEIANHPAYVNYNQILSHAMPSGAYLTPGLNDKLQGRKLSVSGKKKCSYCNNELGRGAAMVIETLCLFYHMECFKCCVCHSQLGDGLMGTDVRVRNQNLHCHNCFSSEDGIKFSCV